MTSPTSMLKLAYSTSYTSSSSSESVSSCSKQDKKVHNRLFYGCSKVRNIQKEGIQRREAIAKANAKRNQVPQADDKTLPLSKAADFYKRCMTQRFERDVHLMEERRKADLKVPKPVRRSIPLSRAGDFYKKSMKRVEFEKMKRSYSCG